MSTLSDLRKSFSEMSTEELHAELTALRTRRRRSNITTQPRKVKSTSILKANLDAIGENGLENLLALLEGKVETRNVKAE